MYGAPATAYHRERRTGAAETTTAGPVPPMPSRPAPLPVLAALPRRIPESELYVRANGVDLVPLDFARELWAAERTFDQLYLDSLDDVGA